MKAAALTLALLLMCGEASAQPPAPSPADVCLTNACSTPGAGALAPSATASPLSRLHPDSDHQEIIAALRELAEREPSARLSEFMRLETGEVFSIGTDLVTGEPRAVLRRSPRGPPVDMFA